jgi:hypothetical protein
VKPRAARLRAAVGALDGDQRFAAIAAASLLVTMFLPWYEKSVVIPGTPNFAHDSISAFGAVSFVEAAIFLVSAGVLALVLTRAEGGRYHLPGGDGTVIFAAGLWATALIFYRVFDRPNVSGVGGTVGIQWGFFVAFVAAGALAFAGQRMRAASRPATPVRKPRPGRRQPPPLDDDDPFADRDDTHVFPSSQRHADGAPATRQRAGAGSSSADRGAVLPAAQRDADVVAASEGRTEVIPASERRTEAGAPQSGRPRDRAVRREDAEQITFEAPEPPEPPLRPPPRGRRTRTD